MKRLWQRLGTISFWLAWPLLLIYLRSSGRTRLLMVCGQEILVMSGWFGNGKWGLPGGGLHRGEAPLAGVLREVREETGVALSESQLTPLLSNTYRDIGFRFPCHYFVATFSQKPAITPQRLEGSRMQWIAHRELNKTNSNPDVLTACAAFFG